jgi:hypothetical protein
MTIDLMINAAGNAARTHGNALLIKTTKQLATAGNFARSVGV